MSEFLKTAVDKFIFKVATDRFYTDGHLWVKLEDGLARVGLSDYLQQTSGDVAFVEAQAEGVELAPGDELANIETMKTSLIVPSPVGGVVKAVNPQLEDEPELVNQDPYGQGWLILVEASDWQADSADLFDANAYYALMKIEAEEEARQL